MRTQCGCSSQYHFFNLTKFVELPCEDMAIKKVLCRLGEDSKNDCKFIVNSIVDIAGEWISRNCKVEKKTCSY